VPSSFPFGAMSVGPSCVTTPVSPVATISIASSRGSRGSGAFVLTCDSGPALTDTPRATRRVRRRATACINGYCRTSSGTRSYWLTGSAAGGTKLGLSLELRDQGGEDIAARLFADEDVHVSVARYQNSLMQLVAVMLP
jgi:hypothetical protein